MKLEKKTFLSLLFGALGVVFFAWALNNWTDFSADIASFLSLFSALFLGCIMAFVLNIPMRFFERHFFPRTKNRFLRKLRRPLCILVSLALSC